MTENDRDQSAKSPSSTSSNSTTEPSPAAVTRPCPACQTEFTSDDDLDTYCPECRERKTAFWAIAAFAVLFVCFVFIPLVVQGCRPWR